MVTSCDLSASAGTSGSEVQSLHVHLRYHSVECDAVQHDISCHSVVVPSLMDLTNRLCGLVLQIISRSADLQLDDDRYEVAVPGDHDDVHASVPPLPLAFHVVPPDDAVQAQEHGELVVGLVLGPAMRPPSPNLHSPARLLEGGAMADPPRIDAIGRCSWCTS